MGMFVQQNLGHFGEIQKPGGKICQIEQGQGENPKHSHSFCAFPSWSRGGLASSAHIIWEAQTFSAC